MKDEWVTQLVRSKSKLLHMKTFLLGAIMLMMTLSQAFAQPEIGVQLYSFRNQFKTDVKGTLEKIHGMGIRLLEGGSTYGMSDQEFIELLNQYGMKVVSYGADFGQLEKDPASVIAKARLYGAEYIVCTWIPHQGNDFTIEDVKRAVKVFTEAGKQISASGMSLCYHPHGYEFRPHDGEFLFDYLVKNTKTEHLNFEMDVFWIKHPGQDPVALLKKYPDRFKLLHLKDRKHGTQGNQNGHADVETNVILGQGDVGIAEIMKVAKEIGIRYAFIEDESSRSLTQVRESLKFLAEGK